MLRLAGSVLLEVHDEWQVAERRYLSEASMAKLRETDDDGGERKGVGGETRRGSPADKQPHRRRRSRRCSHSPTTPRAAVVDCPDRSGDAPVADSPLAKVCSFS